MSGRRIQHWASVGGVVAALSVGAVLLVLGLDRDPAYRVREWLALGRYTRYDPAIRQAADRHGLDPLLVRAVVWRESRFHPAKVGAHGERGLMQVGEAAARDWAVATRVAILQPSDLLDPHTNLEVGCWYLARAVRRWADHPGGEAVALAQYNAGPRRARAWAEGAAGLGEFLDRIEIGSTRDYVKSVLHRRDSYRARDRAGRVDS